MSGHAEPRLGDREALTGLGQRTRFSPSRPLGGRHIPRGDVARRLGASRSGGQPEQTRASAGPPVHVVTAPVVGYFRPNSSLSEGDDVEAGQTVGEVVALGISNEIGSPTDGVFDGFLADDGAPVEYGQGVARIQEK